MKNGDATLPAAPSFLGRSLRALAILCVAYGALYVISAGVQFTVSGRFARGYSYYPWRVGRWLDGTLTICHVAALLALLVGGVGLLKWRRWGRTLLLVWAVSTVLLSFASSAAWFVSYAGSLRATAATTQPAGMSAGYMAFNLFVSCLLGAVFPAIVAWAMMQSEVRDLWPRSSGGGFEVVPFATAGVPTEAREEFR